MSTPRTTRTLRQRITERREQSRAVRSWSRALTRANTPAALAEIEYLYDRVR